jgi:FKBP-type peptidyl-prolyl cis-trans isomerase
MRERDASSVYGGWLWVTSLACVSSLACASSPATPAEAPSGAASDAKAVMAQELGERPAPEGPCPERTEARVLENPRAAVHRTALGLAYCMLQEGPPGVVPGANDVVKVQYSGWNEEGEMFDSSIERGEPVELPLNSVIRGWGEGLRLMTPGDKARLWIPGNLGYGRRPPGAAAGTPPKGTLIFDVELVSIERTPAAPTASAEGAAKNPDDDSKPRLLPKPVPQREESSSFGHRRKQHAPE